MMQADMTLSLQTPELPPLVKRSLARLIRAFAPERILLFGSYAKGMAQCNSDVDLLVIADIEGNPANHQRRARQLTADCFPSVDVVIATPSDVAGAASARSPFLLSILGSSVTLYTRSSDAKRPDQTGLGLFQSSYHKHMQVSVEHVKHVWNCT